MFSINHRPVIRLPAIYCALACILVLSSAQPGRAGSDGDAEMRARFFKLCDVAAAKVSNSQGKGPFFVDSYAVRALCVAYDLTGNQKYIDACRNWSDRMMKYQDQMTPHGAYYMHYNRKPGETNGDWYVADSSSIGMALLATAVRSEGTEKERLLGSAKEFAELVMANYVKSDGGISDGLWHQSSQAWWCSSGIYGSFLFNLYANTGDERYLDTALRAADWLSHWDLIKRQPFPLSQQGPAMAMYVMECYSAGWPYLNQDSARKGAALAKVNWCLNWMTNQQQQPIKHQVWLAYSAPKLQTRTPQPEKVIVQGHWPISKGWGMKFGGLPFHEYIFSKYLPDGDKWTAEGDAEMQRLTPIVFKGKPEFNQLSAFIMMSYAERLSPGSMYRTSGANGIHSTEIKPAEALNAMERVADWQLLHPDTNSAAGWIQAAGDAGIMALAAISRESKYHEAMLALGDTNKWAIGPHIYNADHQCIGQTWTELYLRYRDPTMLAPLIEKFDSILAHPSDATLDFKQPRSKALEVWSWCDSLFMGPPTWIRLYTATGDARYLDFAVTNWWRTADFLYDTNEHLFFRDSTYFDKREANGKKVFWSRGNGWVMAGLVRVLQFLPMNHPGRPRFEQLFKEMAGRVLSCQQSDGLWHSSLLDPEDYPLEETSGSGFFTYAFAWGVNQGLLERTKFESPVEKAWTALVGCVDADGKLTHVQPVGADPKKFDADSTAPFGVGAFLLAGSEVYKMVALEK